MTREPIGLAELFYSFILPTWIYHPWLLFFLLGLTHEVIDISSDSERLEIESERQLIGSLIKQHWNQR